jgi:hypothetical protein
MLMLDSNLTKSLYEIFDIYYGSNNNEDTLRGPICMLAVLLVRLPAFSGRRSQNTDSFPERNAAGGAIANPIIPRANSWTAPYLPLSLALHTPLL